MKPILEIKNISKKFRIRHEHQAYLSLRDSISGLFSAPFSRNSKEVEDYWALKDVSFDVYPGDSIGIIGKNGAGKSTLLKILSKITPPTEGRIISRGRIASLLEVGTGFHQELSGRENIFLNGSILGMKRKEILNKFDEIVDFSGVEKFLDTPLKHYSSGMQLRLAFAVAAFLDPEILVIDEVLAVGDAEFQKKCLGKMEEVVGHGRTILFVSHQMGSLVQLCKKGILLQHGKLKMQDDINKVVNQYLNNEDSKKASKLSLEKEAIKPDDNQIIFVENTDVNGIGRVEFNHDEQIIVDCALSLNNYNPNLEFAISLYDRMKRRIFTIHEPLHKHRQNNLAKFKIVLPANFLTPGNYSWLMCITHPGINYTEIKDDVCHFQIIDNGSVFSKYEGADYGCVFVDYKVIPN
ncbi:MAG: ATP-binding cassette domain-containing protein [Bacteroidetes bacterium]|nr:MAG: ATP-binding cassette domain-containing protein [Bacteroidota bacterium]